MLLCGLLLAVGGCARQHGEVQRIGVVDINRVFQESQAGQQGMAYLQSINEEFRKTFEELQAEIEEDEEANAQKMQQAIMEYQARINHEQERIVTLLNEEFATLLESFRRDNNYVVLLSNEAVLSAGEGADVTDRIIQEFDRIQLDLQPEAAPPAAQEPEPGAPAGQDGAQ
jgi:Skp family chaperone for outer membrane proteins